VPAPAAAVGFGEPAVVAGDAGDEGRLVVAAGEPAEQAATATTARAITIVSTRDVLDRIIASLHS
jgi:hypothetical protein